LPWLQNFGRGAAVAPARISAVWPLCCYWLSDITPYSFGVASSGRNPNEISPKMGSSLLKFKYARDGPRDRHYDSVCVIFYLLNQRINIELNCWLVGQHVTI
jgi:hypothetical protein